MNMRQRTTKNVRRQAALRSDAEILQYTSELVEAGLRGAYIIELTGLPKLTVDAVIDRDRGLRKPGKAKGAVALFQDDATLRLHASVFLHAYMQARETDSFTEPGAFVRALRALNARAPGHDIHGDVLFYALKQMAAGVFALQRCPACGSHYLRVQPTEGTKRTLEGDCFVCSYRFRPPGRSTSIAGKDLLALAKGKSGP